jgi:hypothetical protein
VSKEPARIAAGWHHLWHYTSMSHYASSLQTALDHLGEDRLRVWFYDDLERDYAGTLAAVMRFIGVDENATHVTSMDRVNSSGAPRNAWISGLLKSATGNETIRSGVKAVTTYRFRERVRRMVLRRSTATPEVVAEMRGLFDEDRARLRAMLPALVGSPLPEWLASQGELR